MGEQGHLSLLCDCSQCHTGEQGHVPLLCDCSQCNTGEQGHLLCECSQCNTGEQGHLLCDCSQCNTGEQGHLCDCSQCNKGEQARALVIVVWLQPVQNGRTSQGTCRCCVTAASATRANKPGHLSLLCDCSQCNTGEQARALVVVVWLQPVQHGRTSQGTCHCCVTAANATWENKGTCRCSVNAASATRENKGACRCCVNATSATWENKDTCSWWVYRQSCCPRNLKLVVQYKNQGSIFKRSPWFDLFFVFVFKFELFYRLGGTWNEMASSFNAFSTQ